MEHPRTHSIRHEDGPKPARRSYWSQTYRSGPSTRAVVGRRKEHVLRLHRVHSQNDLAAAAWLQSIKHLTPNRPGGTQINAR